MSRIQLVILDFDGTLVDTAPDLIVAANKFLRSKGLDELPESRIREEIGMGLSKLILDVYPKSNLSEPAKRKISDEFVEVYATQFLNAPRLYDGAFEFLSEWDGQKAIVSNKRERFIHPILKKLKIEAMGWSSIIGGDTFKEMKPHPRPFLEAIKAAGVSPEETLIVGDGQPDVQGALAVGSPCAVVEFGYTPYEELIDLGAWKSIDSFAQLLPLIASIT